MNKTEISKQFVKQHGEYSCGLACLASITNYYGGSITQQELMRSSGTTLNGTSMLGLYQAATKIGFEARGFEAEISHLKELKDPVILHVVIDEKREHFIVCYGFRDKFLIGDPGWGVTEYSEQELEAIWKSKTLLQLKPSEAFEKTTETANEKWLWFKEMIHEDIPILVVSAFIGIIVAILGLSTAIYSQKLIDEYLPDKNLEKIYLGLGLLAVLLLIRALFSYVRGILMVRQSRDLNERVISNFINKILYLPQSFFNGHSTGDFIARMNDAQRIQRTVSLVTGTIIIELLVIVISSIYVFYLSYFVGLVSISSIVFFLLLALKYHKRIVDKQREVMVAYAANESNYVDTLQGNAIIKSFGRENMFIDRLTAVYKLFQGKMYELGNLGNSYGFFTSSIAGIYIVLIFLVGINLVLKESLQLGEFVALLSVGGSLVPSLSNLTVSNIQIQEAKVAFDRMHEFVKEETENINLEPGLLSERNSIHSIKIENLRFRFPGRKPILDKVNLTISKGKIVALYGEVGSGKSTLVDILQGFYNFEDGEILIGGKDIKQINNGELRSKIAIVPQKEKIFNSTIIDNICLSNNQNELQEAVDLCSQEGFDFYINKFQQGYLTLTGENGVNLSGGQRQLISLARALYKKPEFLILDEATAAMDTETEDFVFSLLKRRKDLGTLIITHRKDLVEKADMIYQLKNNEVTLFADHGFA
jgi:ABC-type bacteriocin/lantibiotic exporter with double-glycine peptidase domain